MSFLSFDLKTISKKMHFFLMWEDAFLNKMLFFVFIAVSMVQTIQAQEALDSAHVSSAYRYSGVVPAARMPEIKLSSWIGSGDALRITVFPDTASFIGGIYTVMDSGYIQLPILGLVKASDKSPAELSKILVEAYIKHLRYPYIQIEPLVRVSLLGGFIRPGVHMINPMYPLSSAFAAAGGTVRDDGLKLMRWERDGKVLKKNLTTMVEGRESLTTLGVKSGDQICVTTRNRPGKIEIVSVMLSAAVTSATLILAYQGITQSNRGN